MAVSVVYPGPQREIFPGGTKVDNGPPNLFGHQTCAKFFVLYFCPKLGEINNKKRSLLKFSPIFCPKLGKVYKKRFSLKFSPIFCPKLGEEHKKND